jgi:hypothetical protein
MGRKSLLLGSIPLLMAFLFFIGVNVALANGSVRETQFLTSISEVTGIVRVIVAVFGGLIGILGIILAFRGIGGTADVSMSVSGQGNLSIKRISQGVVITLIGAAILIGAVYFLPEKKYRKSNKG